MTKLNIAVIGAGISGLSAAWLLGQRHAVTLYEQEDRLGGHANTVDVKTPSRQLAVDTGFIVYNERNYPNLIAFFDALGIATKPTEMSFAFSADDGAYEYAGSGLNGFFGQRRNALKPSHWQLIREISRFFATAGQRIQNYPGEISLGAFLQEEGYSQGFVEQHIVPMGAAIWSTTMVDMLGFPARSFVNFYANHGMLQFRDRPPWRTLVNGSRSYVRRIVESQRFAIERACAVRRLVRRPGYVQIEDERGVTRPFDHVVIATHADQALRLLADPDSQESETLGAFKYQTNHTVLHRDRRWMPRRERLWSSWNYMKQGEGLEAKLCVTYWMNRLQNLAGQTNLFVTLNPTRDIHPKAIDYQCSYDHPVFSSAALRAQKNLWLLQGQRRTWFCGSYFGFGFHEDGLQSGLAVAELLGGQRRPWAIEPSGDRIGFSSALPSVAAE